MLRPATVAGWRCPKPRFLVEVVLYAPALRSAFLPCMLFLSGCSALVYQMVWLREFRLVFGGATPAAAAVLAVYMGGLGLGGAWFGRRSERSEHLLRLYGALEAAVGVCALLTPALLYAVRALYIRSGGVVALGPVTASLLQVLLSVVVLLPPCTLMGGTLPVAVRWAQTDADSGRGSAGLLYGVNALGAVAGTAISTFFLLELLGARGTLYAAAALNLAIAAAALAMAARGAEGAKAQGIQPMPASCGGGREAGTGTPRDFAYAAAFTTGFVFFLGELVWYRMLAPLMGSSTYTLGLILVVVLCGIGIGGALYRNWASWARGRVNVGVLGLALAVQACWLALPCALGDRFAVFAFEVGRWRAHGFAGQLASWAVVAGAAAFLPSLVAGFQFPLLIGLLGRGRAGVGRQLGYAYAANTAGALLGSLLGGFLLIPALSAPGCWWLAAGLTGLLALWALALARRHAGRRLLACGAGLLAVLVGMVAASRGPTAFWRHSPIGYGWLEELPRSPVALEDFIRDRRRRTHRQVDGREASVGLLAGNSYSLFINGKSDGAALGDAPTQVMLGLVGAALHPRPRSACVVGLGTGTSAGWLADVSGMERVDVVEIEPAIRDLARDAFAPVNRDVLRKANVRVVLGDAREMLLVRGPAYDVVASEPSNPFRPGVASLYTREFYQSVRARLSPDGIFCQWLQGYQVDKASVGLVCATLSSVFPYVEIWVTKPGDLLFVCHQMAPAYSVAHLRQRLAEAPFAEALRRAWLTDSVEGFLARHYAGPELAHRLAAGQARVNTDDRNLLEYELARAMGQHRARFTTAELLDEATRMGVDLPGHLLGQLDADRLLEERLMISAARSPAEGGGSSELPAEARAGDSRRLAMLAYSNRDWAGVLSRWGSPPRSLKGRLILAEAAAQAGTPETALALLDSLAPDWPVEARLDAARLDWRLGARDAARQNLQAALAGMQQFPWLRERPVIDGLRLACTLGDGDPEAAAAFFALLAHPFPVAAYDDERLMARLLLSQRLPLLDQVAAVAAFEPDPPWNREFLAQRQAVYAAAGDPRAAAARRDLERFPE